AEDECGLGLKPIARRVWSPRGHRPRSGGRTRYDWLYVYGFTRPRTGETFAPLLPRVNADRMGDALAALAAHAHPGRREVLVGLVDHAGRPVGERQQAQHARGQGRKAADVSGRLRYARPVEARAVALAEDVALLVRWLRQDILAVAGPDHEGRCALYDWVVAELRRREEQCPHRIRPVRTLLEN